MHLAQEPSPVHWLPGHLPPVLRDRQSNDSSISDHLAFARPVPAAAKARYSSAIPAPTSGSWKNISPANPTSIRGISRQTTPQMWCACREDVIRPYALPKVLVHPGGHQRHRRQYRVRLLTANDIEAILCFDGRIANARLQPLSCGRFFSIRPVNFNYIWHPVSRIECSRHAFQPAREILELNRWLKAYCASNGYVYLDYFSAMVDDKGFTEARSCRRRPAPQRCWLQLMVPLAQAGN